MKEFFNFIKSSPTAFHTVENIRRRLISEGYTELYENTAWELVLGKGYFTVRGGSAIIAFRMTEGAESFMIAASHADSPSFKVKISEETVGAYCRLPVEKYGGMIMYSWFDRPLGVAGRIAVRTQEGISTRLVNLDNDIMTIPSVSIHQNRSVNEGFKPNPAKDMIPLLGTGAVKGDFRATVAKSAGALPEDIISHDLFAYVREEPHLVGLENEIILSPRLDDLECVFASTEAFLSSKNSRANPVLAVFDNEEVGSATLAGADSSFLPDVLKRIAGSEERYIRMLTSSMVVSADNAHALHPNAPELSDAENAPVLGGGVVIKYNGNKRYATDAVSSALFMEIASAAGVKTQSYYNRADMPGGSTLGSILNTQLAVRTVDIGLPQLAMHSAVESADKRDLTEMKNALTAFFEKRLEARGNFIKIV